MGNSDTNISVPMSQDKARKQLGRWLSWSRRLLSIPLFECHILCFHKEIPHRVLSNTLVNKCGRRKAMGIFLSRLDKRSRTTFTPIQSAPPKPLTRLLPQLLQLSSHLLCLPLDPDPQLYLKKKPSNYTEDDGSCPQPWNSAPWMNL